MHELSLALSLVDGIEEESAARGGLRVRAVRLRLGRHSGISLDALQYAYAMACDGTPLAGTCLKAEITAGAELEVAGLEVDP